MIRAGAAQIDITPPVGRQLSGFALRQQPSVGLLDPLHAKALFMDDGAGHRLLWIHADLIGLDSQFVADFRQRAQKRWSLTGEQVLLSATHTHSGPASVYLFHAGEIDAPYLQQLAAWFEQAGDAAMAAPRPCRCAVGVAELDLAVDRRHKPSAHVDRRLTTLTLQTETGEYLAAIVNYAMHPVTLGLQNRMISADYCGHAAALVRERLAGKPLVLITNGACGNLNPPALNVTPPQVRQWAGQIAEVALQAVAQARSSDEDQFTVTAERIALAPQDATIEQVESHAARYFYTPLQSRTPEAKAAAQVIDQAARRWASHRISDIRRHGAAPDIDIELFILRMPGLNIVGVNAEVFSRFSGLVREQTNLPICTLGYANGVIGYLPTRQAFAEGGYEVETAMFYYDAFRPACGSLEKLASRAADLIKSRPSL